MKVEEDEEKDNTEGNWISQCFNQKVWSPYLTGGIIGLLQIPSVVLMHTALGTSSVFSTLAGHVMELFNYQNPYFAAHMYHKKSYWHVALAIGTVVGSYIAKETFMKLKHKKHKEEPKDDITMTRKRLINFGGGFLMLFGSRMADGGIMSHLSGFYQLSCASFLTLASVLGGGMIASVIPSILL